MRAGRVTRVDNNSVSEMQLIPGLQGYAPIRLFPICELMSREDVVREQAIAARMPVSREPGIARRIEDRNAHLLTLHSP